MKLTKFRVQNYKKIQDTGWISCRELTVFVGKNEAGKSAVFRGLSKLNPSDGEKYDGLKEFPRRRYTDEFGTQDWPVATGVFSLDQDERAKLTSLCPPLKDVKAVQCTRHYSWELDVEFEPFRSVEILRVGAFLEALEKAKTKIQDLTAPEGKGDALGTLKTNLQNSINGLAAGITNRQKDEPIAKSDAEQAVSVVTRHLNEPWQKDLLQSVVQEFRGLVEQALASQRLNEARNWVEKNLPRFIYFDRYDVIDSAIHLPSFQQQAQSTPNGPRVRTTQCLFKHVGLDLNKLGHLGRHQPGQGEDSGVRRQIDERTILSSSASNAMTQKFADWWDQRKHKFHYRVDGDYFRIWVSDDLDPSEIELDQRSAGMQYFFSFFTVFLVEAQGRHEGSVLLLDEPGLHLHGTAQGKIVKFLEKLSRENQTMYTTHSPFLVDGDHLERARAVHEHEDGTTKVSEDVWPRDKDSLFPLQAALGYQLAQSLFLSKRQVILEGITDYWLIKAVAQGLSARNLPSLRPDVVLLPSAGASKLIPLASMLIGHEIEIAALLDGDEPARKEGKKLVDKLLAGQDRRCLFIGDFLAHLPKGEIEDVFPETDYLSAAQEAYPGLDLAFGTEEKGVAGVVNRLQGLFKRKGYGDFEKWKPAQVLRDRLLAEPVKIPEQVCDIMTKVFQTLNSLFTKSA
jgi:predicted ATPase